MFCKEMGMKFFDLKRISVFLIICLWHISALAQVNRSVMSLERINDFYYKQMITAGDNQRVAVVPNASFTALVIKVSSDDTFDGAYIVHDGITIALRGDEHALIGEMLTSNMISFDENPNQFEIYAPNVKGGIEIHYLNAKPNPPKKQRKMRRQDDECQEPGSVAQSDWRSGLNAPSYSRQFHQVEHLIVHHSAGSNSITNYEQEVRNIYLLHTQVNGWSDIGYNYLVAPDGVIFKGRDPATGAQDDVRGAHFCGQNSNTMGICLLGTFINVAPTDEAIASLVSILGWKADKESLDPFASSSHSANSNLGVIAGHRDGCATECPGQMTYDRLPAIRTQTQEFIDACDGTVDPDPDPDPVEPGPFAVFPNPVTEGKLTINTGEGTVLNEIFMNHSSGKAVAVKAVATATRQVVLSTDHLTPGLYLLKLIYPDKKIKKKVLVF